MNKVELPKKLDTHLEDWVTSVVALENKINEIINYLKAKEEEADR